jgi:hypothetical protein
VKLLLRGFPGLLMRSSRLLHTLQGLADRICKELGILCFSDLSGEELEKMLMFAFTWIETFYYIYL